MNNKEVYIAVSWPEIQEFMKHERWGECCYYVDKDIYMVPIDLYDEVIGDLYYIIEFF